MKCISVTAIFSLDICSQVGWFCLFVFSSCRPSPCPIAALVLDLYTRAPMSIFFKNRPSWMKGAGNINWSQEKNQNHYVCTHPANKQKQQITRKCSSNSFFGRWACARIFFLLLPFSRIKQGIKRQQLNNSPDSFGHICCLFSRCWLLLFCF